MGGVLSVGDRAAGHSAKIGGGAALSAARL